MAAESSVTTQEPTFLAQELEEDAANNSYGMVTELVTKAVDKFPRGPWLKDQMISNSAKFAISAYAARNSIFKDLQELPDILPDDQVQYQTLWRCIIGYFRDRGWFPEVRPSRPVDLTTLPRKLRGHPFDSEKLRESGAEYSKERSRRIATRSDPTQHDKRKRDEEFSDSLEGEPLTKVCRLEDTNSGSSELARLEEQYKKLLSDLHHTLQQLSDKYLGQAINAVQSMLGEARERLAESSEQL
ncbi:MAG: hypothetical protein Q9163_004960 [Psora crenata]